MRSAPGSFYVSPSTDASVEIDMIILFALRMGMRVLVNQLLELTLRGWVVRQRCMF